MEKKKIDEAMREKLRASFPKEAYSKHPTKTFLTTLKAMYVTERLNNVFGVGRWSIKCEVVSSTPDYVLMQGEFVSLDYDVLTSKQYGGHKCSGKNTELADGYKSAVTDCQSKIASYLEVGIDMFKGLVPGGGVATQETAPAKSSSMLDMVRDKAKKLFKDTDDYKLWRIDNALAENVKEADEFELTKILMKLKEKEKNA